MSGAPTQADPAIERFRATYFEECAELVDSVYTHLNELSEGRGNSETLHAIFRAVHSIKGWPAPSKVVQYLS